VKLRQVKNIYVGWAASSKIPEIFQNYKK